MSHLQVVGPPQPGLFCSLRGCREPLSLFAKKRNRDRRPTYVCAKGHHRKTCLDCGKQGEAKNFSRHVCKSNDLRKKKSKAPARTKRERVTSSASTSSGSSVSLGHHSDYDDAASYASDERPRVKARTARYRSDGVVVAEPAVPVPSHIRMQAEQLQSLLQYQQHQQYQQARTARVTIPGTGASPPVEYAGSMSPLDSSSSVSSAGSGHVGGYSPYTEERLPTVEELDDEAALLGLLGDFEEGEDDMLGGLDPSPQFQPDGSFTDFSAATVAAIPATAHGHTPDAVDIAVQAETQLYQTPSSAISVATSHPSNPGSPSADPDLMMSIDDLLDEVPLPELDLEGTGVATPSRPAQIRVPLPSVQEQARVTSAVACSPVAPPAGYDVADDALATAALMAAAEGAVARSHAQHGSGAAGASHTTQQRNSPAVVVPVLPTPAHVKPAGGVFDWVRGRVSIYMGMFVLFYAVSFVLQAGVWGMHTTVQESSYQAPQPHALRGDATSVPVMTDTSNLQPAPLVPQAPGSGVGARDSLGGLADGDSPMEDAHEATAEAVDGAAAFGDSAEVEGAAVPASAPVPSTTNGAPVASAGDVIDPRSGEVIRPRTGDSAPHEKAHAVATGGGAAADYPASVAVHVESAPARSSNQIGRSNPVVIALMTSGVVALVMSTLVALAYRHRHSLVVSTGLTRFQYFRNMAREVAPPRAVAAV